MYSMVDDLHQYLTAFCDLWDDARIHQILVDAVHNGLADPVYLEPCVTGGFKRQDVLDIVEIASSEQLDMENYRLNIVRGTTDIALNLFAFSGIHSFSPRLFLLMERFPDRFPIIDFYLQTCHRTRIYGCQKDDLRLLDVGKIESLEKAEEFIQDT